MKNSSTGLKRKVSPTTSIIIIAGVICLIFVIAFGGKVWSKITTKHTDSKTYTTGSGGRGERLRLSNERLGADLNPVPDVKSGGLVVRGISPEASGELQVGDIITAMSEADSVVTV